MADTNVTKSIFHLVAEATKTKLLVLASYPLTLL